MPGLATVMNGDELSFQLLDSDGVEVKNAEWSLETPGAGSLVVKDGRAVVHFALPGQILIKASANGFSDAAVAIVGTRDVSVPAGRWAFRSINGKLREVIQAVPNNDGPSYFYEDAGENRTQIRAVDDQGLQRWIWPPAGSRENPSIVCGDNKGGVVLSTGEMESKVLIDLDTHGHEAWRFSAPRFDDDAFTFTQINRMYFIEEDADHKGARIIGLDATAGTQQLAQELPVSRQLMKNLTRRGDNLVCKPHAEQAELLPIRRSGMFGDTESVAHAAVSELEIVADGGDCVANSIVSPKDVRLTYSQKLILFLLQDDGKVTSAVIEQNRGEGTASDLLLTLTLPAGDIIPDPTGTGNFIAVHRTTQHWPQKGPVVTQDFEYRFTSDGQLKLRVPMPEDLSGKRTVTALGENEIGFTTRNKTLIAFNTATGAEKWRWEGPKRPVEIQMALADGGVIVRNNGDYFEVKDGKVTTRYSDEQFLFVERWRLRETE